MIKNHHQNNKFITLESHKDHFLEAYKWQKPTLWLAFGSQ